MIHFLVVIRFGLLMSMVKKGYLLNVLIWAWFGDQGMVSDVSIRVEQKNGRPPPPGYNWLYLKKRSFRKSKRECS